MYRYFFLAFFSLSLNYAAYPDPVYSENGMVVSLHHEASSAGIKILQKGGNAIDAAVAVGFALAVTCPENGNLGGGGFMIGATSKGEIFSQDHREKAPISANKDMFLNDSGNVANAMLLIAAIFSVIFIY